MQNMDTFPSTRQATLQRLEEFVHSGAADYARTRNFVKAGHGNVSRLSAALRHRLISEEEVLAAVLAALRFKCNLLWAQLDALHFAYVAPGLPPPGAFIPEGQAR
jgi:deoxyribodipyrimidine photolyase